MTDHDADDGAAPPMWEDRIDGFWRTVDLDEPDAAITRMRRLIDDVQRGPNCLSPASPRPGTM